MTTRQELTTFIPYTQTQSIILPNTSFRPSSFNEYIGQTNLKFLLQKFIIGTKTKKKPFPHTLLFGNAGYGKTTLARILANKLNLPFTEVIGTEANSEQISDFIMQAQNGILFIDEIHAVDREIVELLYPAMEDFMFRGKPLGCFTLMGATTEIGEIIKTRRPFYDRFKILGAFKEYTIPELTLILKQYKQKVFPEDPFNASDYYILAKNARNTPRHGIRLLETAIYFNDNIKKVLDTFNIIKDGYTIQDLTVLNYLYSNMKGVGLKGLAMYLDTSEENYLYAIEPFLLKNGLLTRTGRGRLITPKGISILEQLKSLHQGE